MAGTGPVLERSGHRVPPGQRWAGRRAGPSQAEPLPPPSKHRGETRRPWRPGRPAGCPPQGLSPGLWSAFRGKVAQSVKCKVKQSQRTLGETRHSARQDSSTEARRPGGRPPRAHRICHTSGPFSWTFSWTVPLGGQARAGGC